MLITNSVNRIAWFYRRNGLRCTAVRFCTALRRFSYLGRMVLYACQLPGEYLAKTTDVSVRPVTPAGISKPDYECLLDIWNPSLRAHQLADRFAAGSELWLAKVGDKLAGFGWTIQGRTIEPYFFPLRPDDAHLFDFFVFPEFRGRGINVVLVMEILAMLSQKQVHRAYIECAAWNDAEIRSLSKTAFRRYAEATQVTLLGYTIVVWH